MFGRFIGKGLEFLASRYAPVQEKKEEPPHSLFSDPSQKIVYLRDSGLGHIETLYTLSMENEAETNQTVFNDAHLDLSNLVRNELVIKEGERFLFPISILNSAVERNTHIGNSSPVNSVTGVGNELRVVTGNNLYVMRFENIDFCRARFEAENDSNYRGPLPVNR